jgi:hypothetical protein
MTEKYLTQECALPNAGTAFFGPSSHVTVLAYADFRLLGGGSALIGPAM